MSRERELLKRWIGDRLLNDQIYRTLKKETEELLAEPERKPLQFEIDGSFEYRDGFIDGVLYAEKAHGIGVDNEDN